MKVECLARLKGGYVKKLNVKDEYLLLRQKSFLDESEILKQIIKFKSYNIIKNKEEL